MVYSRSKLSRSRFMRSAALIGLATLAAPVLAQDCTLEIQAVPQVILPGQSAFVGVHAGFPAGFYAFASGGFDVGADTPAWRAASAGTIVGADVVGIQVAQAHSPQNGVLADPSNPVRVWSGVFTPESYAPAFVEFEVLPTSFSVFPSNMTPSSIPCDAVGSRAWVMVNPVRLGAYGAAPGAGTNMDDVFIEGRIITAEAAPGGTSTLVGLLVPAVQKSPAAGTRASFGSPPSTMSFRAHVSGDGRPLDSYSFNFERLENGAGYAARTDLPLGVGLQIQFSHAGRVVAAVATPQGETPLFRAQVLPDTFGARIEQPPDTGSRPVKFPRQVSLVGRFTSDRAQPFILPDGRVITADTVEVSAAVGRINNIRQIGLALHSYAATDARTMTLQVPRQ